MKKDSQYWKEYYSRHKEYYKTYYENNKIRIKEYYKKRYECSMKDNRNRAIVRNKSLKSDFLKMYGEKCDCCKETTYEFLCLDHIKGKERKYKNESGNVAYKRALKEYDPLEYRILCANCNQATKRGQICPHKRIAN